MAATEEDCIRQEELEAAAERAEAEEVGQAEAEQVELAGADLVERVACIAAPRQKAA